MSGEIAQCFKKAFLDSYQLYNKYIYDKVGLSKTLRYKDFEIIRDVPSTVFQRIRKRYLEIIKNAVKEVIIETPYFLPGSFVRKALMEAARRGVNIKIIVPMRSDVGLIDIIRSRYFGEMFKEGIEIFFYYPQNLHAKVLMADNKIFSIATANFDYRSFRFQHEIALIGIDKSIIRKLQEHFAETINNCERFNYEVWKGRPLIQKWFEKILIPFRHFF
jgi:cardiolipin synthase